ncbi:MAG: DUF2058 family protein [Pseudomonadota bacterium]
MARSLQEQLLALGIANESQIPKPKSKAKSGPGGKPAGKGGAKARKGRGKPRKAPRPDARQSAPTGKKRGAQVELSPEERALRQRVHQLITDNHEPRGEEAQVPFHFVKGSRVKRIYVTEDQQRRLSADELAVAAMKGRHYVIPTPVAQQIHELIPPYFISMGAQDQDINLTDVDDEYAEFQVPDDLMW